MASTSGVADAATRSLRRSIPRSLIHWTSRYRQCGGRRQVRRLLRERIRAELHLHELRGGPLAALEVPGGAAGRRGPQALPFPSGCRGVDTAGDQLDEEPHRVRYAQSYPRAVLEEERRVGQVARRY